MVAASIWQISNYLIPLITFPYLAHILGVDGVGLVGISAAITSFALLVTNWGFPYTATQAVAANQQDVEAISQIIWNTIASRAILGAIAIAIMLVGSFFVAENLSTLILISTLNVLALIFNVDWVLRGLEDFSKFAIATVAGRILVIPAVFILVQQSNDISYAVLATAVGSISAAFFTSVVVYRKGVLRKPDITIVSMLDSIVESTHLFVSTLAVAVYTDGLSLIVGLASGVGQVGLYVGADKIRKPGLGVLWPFSLVFFPRMNVLAKSNPEAANSMAFQLLAGIGILTFSVSACLSIFASEIVHVFLGASFFGAIIVLRFQAWLIFLIGLNTVLGTMMMLPFGLKRQFTICTIAGSISGLVACVPLAYFYGALGASASALLAEIVVVILMAYYLRTVLSNFSIRTSMFRSK
tara:strand:- start:1348 stop:2583 length:1236 start_codon:yes stop_codon:yes gene_type:complete